MSQVLLFDEFEKAHREVQNMLLQVREAWPVEQNKILWR